MPPEAEALASPSRGASSTAAGPQYTARPAEDLKASLLKLHNASGDRNKDAAQLEVIEWLVTTPPANANRSHPLGAQPHTAVRAIFSALHGVAMYTAEAAADVRARAPRAVFVYGTLRPDCRDDGDVWRVTTVGDCVWRRGSVRGYQLHQDPAKRYPYAVKTGNNADVRTTKKIKRDANALHIACSKTGWGGGLGGRNFNDVLFVMVYADIGRLHPETYTRLRYTRTCICTYAYTHAGCIRNDGGMECL